MMWIKLVLLALPAHARAKWQQLHVLGEAHLFLVTPKQAEHCLRAALKRVPSLTCSILGAAHAVLASLTDVLLHMRQTCTW